MTETPAVAVPAASTAAATPAVAPKPKKKAKKKGAAKARKVQAPARIAIRPTFLEKQIETFARNMIAPYLSSMDQSKVHGFGSLHVQFVNQFGTISPDLFRKALTVLGVQFTSGTRVVMANDPRKEIYEARVNRPEYRQTEAQPRVIPAPLAAPIGNYNPTGNPQQVSPRLAAMVNQRAALDAGYDGIPSADAYNGPNTAGVASGNDVGFDNERR